MHGPPLTPNEAVATVARQVRRLEAAGIDRDQAIRRVAADNGIAAEKVRWCADTALSDAIARPTDQDRGASLPCRHSESRRHHDYDNTRRTGSAALRSRARRVRALVALAAALLVGTGAGVATGKVTLTASTTHGCLSADTGQLHVIDEALGETCTQQKRSSTGAGAG
jgi:hypothetical protein